MLVAIANTAEEFKAELIKRLEWEVKCARNSLTATQHQKEHGPHASGITNKELTNLAYKLSFYESELRFIQGLTIVPKG